MPTSDDEDALLLQEIQKLLPMTERERREQAASFAYGNLALMKKYDNASPTTLAHLRDMCRKAAGLP